MLLEEEEAERPWREIDARNADREKGMHPPEQTAMSTAIGRPQHIQDEEGNERNDGTPRSSSTSASKTRTSIDFDVKYPDWWQKVPDDGIWDDSKEIMPAKLQQIDAVQSLIDRTWKDITTRDRAYGKIPRIKVVQVQQNHNPRLWNKYVTARERVRKLMTETDQQSAFTTDVQKQDPDKFECLGHADSSINEFLPFHGTRPSACASICDADFMVSLAGSGAGTLYGNGIYLGENSSKSDEYAKEEEDGIYAGLCAMLLCRVTRGRMY